VLSQNITVKVKIRALRIKTTFENGPRGMLKLSGISDEKSHPSFT
jgi:hypothetical protein